MKPRHVHRSDDCRIISDILQHIGDKWTVLVVSTLGTERMRFNALRRTIGGISQKILTSTLRKLERDGFVTRTVHPTVPPSVDYELTPLGRELLVPVKALGDWAYINTQRIHSARRAFDERSAER